VNDTYDVAVVGAGPAGASAALAAARRGLKTVIIDEQPQAGGQVWRAKYAAILSAPATPESSQGAALREALESSSVAQQYHARVWQIEQKELWRLGLIKDDGASTLTARALILATGAQERVSPVPGWTLPGTIGLAGATAMFKRDLILPGRRTIVAGCGPLLFYVATEILRLGGSVVAVISLNGRADWLRASPAMAMQPDLLRRGLVWMAQLKKARVPILWRHAVATIDGTDGVASATAIPVDADWAPMRAAQTRRFEADGVCLGHGLSPAVEASRLAGATHIYRPEFGGWIPQTDDDGAASTPMLWACGDGAGILGVGAAPLRGELAGLAAARALGAMSETDHMVAQRALLRELAKARRFGVAMTKLTLPRRGLLDLITPGTTICRCENVRRDKAEAEIASGAVSPNALKSATRLGMGPCGGRFCMETAAELAAAATGRTREDIGLPTIRPPLRPVPLGALAGDFNYDDLPIPGAAPL
jgi:thioredoxin reductase